MREVGPEGGVGEETVPSTTERSRLKILDFLFGSFKE